MTQPKIMVVDDEPLNIMIMQELLEGNYTLFTCENGVECLENVASFAPDLILMDVNMPKMDGLEACQQLKNNPDTQNIPVIFVSALSRTEEKMAGYKAGGEDYIPKPFEEDELQAKVIRALDNKQKLEELRRNSNDAMQTAMTALTNAGEIGTVLRFFQDTFTINDFTELGVRLANACSEYGLNSSVLITIKEQQYRISSSGVIKPLQFSVLDELRNADRIFDFEYRTVFNFPNISFLILNMPVSNQEFYGRLKDHLALFGEGAQARINSLLAEQERIKQATKRKNAMNSVRETLELFDQQQREAQYTSSAIIQKMQLDMELLFNRLGLTDEQEDELTGTIEKASHELEQIHEMQALLGKRLEQIVELLK